MSSLPTVSPDKQHSLLTLIAPLLLLTAAFGLLGVANTFGSRLISDENTLNALFHLTSTLLWISGAFLLIRLIDAVVWQRLMVARGYHAPRLLRQIIAALIWFWAACGVVSLVYGLSLTTLIAASTVSMGVAGFALQRPILDAFSGIVLALQRPFEIGDWLLVDEESGVGRVTEMNWRAVHLVTPNEVTLVVPNGHFTSNQAVLYSRPQQFFRDEIKVTLPYNVTTHQGQRILLGAVNQIDEIAAIPRNSIISIADYTERGILWRILYWCPDAGRVPVFRFKVHQNILRNLHYAGIEIPMPKLDLRRIPARPEQSDEISDIDPLILHIPIFVVFTEEELRQLSTQSNNRLAHAGTPLLRQGEAGNSLFILREGMLEVRKAKEGQAETVVGRIQPGDFFGEMSLLLGEPRSATVVPIVDSMIIEISRDTMTQLMQGRPELANYLAELLAERQADSAAKIASAQIDYVEQQPQSILEQTIIRIRTLFSLG